MSGPRTCGILLHPTSLPGPYGVGDLGPAADAFVSFLAETGQTWWQMLPLGPIGPGHSPYQSPSSFAGNPLLISPEVLLADKLITREDLAAYPKLPEGHADYDKAAVAKEKLLDAAYGRWPKKSAELDDFRAKNADWLDDFALYTVLKAAHGGQPWYRWERPQARRDRAALDSVRAKQADKLRRLAFVQFVFDKQWRRLREVCQRAGVRLIGDIPMYVSDDGADVWARPDLFLLGRTGKPRVVAGVPPDDFSATGQRWGNPLYDWEAHKREKYQWWVRRLAGTLDRVDFVRLDHFLGIVKFYKIPAKYRTARVYEQVEGPGAAFLKAVRAAFPQMPIIAEDLGLVDDAARRLRDAHELPGMRVFHFVNLGFDLELRPWGGGSKVPTSVKARIVVGTDASGRLYIRVFDTKGELAMNTNEGRLPDQKARIDALKELLPDPLRSQKLKKTQERRIREIVTSIVGPTIDTTVVNGDHLPEEYVAHCVAYSGTHDNDTTIGWYQSLTADERAIVDAYLNDGTNDVNWKVIVKLYESVANTVIIPLQDVLGLDTRARMNVPGKQGDYWAWRFKPKDLNAKARAQLAETTRAHGRGRT